VISRASSEITAEMDNGLEWKDGDTMIGRVVLAGDYTVCMLEANTARQSAYIHFSEQAFVQTQNTKYQENKTDSLPAARFG
jgi:hypothetical protein